MKDVFANVLSIFLGVIAVLYNGFLAKKAVNFQKKFFNFDADEISYKIGCLIGGIVFIIMGILSLFGIIQWR